MKRKLLIKKHLLRIKQVNGSINSTIEMSNNAKITFAEETNQVIKTIKSFDSMKLAIENVVSSIYDSINSINLIKGGKHGLSKNLKEVLESFKF